MQTIPFNPYQSTLRQNQGENFSCINVLRSQDAQNRHVNSMDTVVSDLIQLFSYPPYADQILVIPLKTEEPTSVSEQKIDIGTNLLDSKQILESSTKSAKKKNSKGSRFDYAMSTSKIDKDIQEGGKLKQKSQTMKLDEENVNKIQEKHIEDTKPITS